jgi:trehalose-6-phosphate synthase
VLRVLPVYAELLQSMLAYDVLGFQTDSDRDAFRHAVASVWGAQILTSDQTVTLGGRRVVTGVFPIGVDVDAIQREAIDSQATDACKRMIAGLLGRRLMIGVDRLDYSKGLVERFKAYERFLETHPENQNRVTFCRSRRCRAATCAPTPKSAAISSRPPAAPTAASPTPTGHPSDTSTGISRTMCSWDSCVRRSSVS